MVELKVVCAANLCKKPQFADFLPLAGGIGKRKQRIVAVGRDEPLQNIVPGVPFPTG